MRTIRRRAAITRRGGRLSLGRQVRSLRDTLGDTRLGLDRVVFALALGSVALLALVSACQRQADEGEEPEPPPRVEPAVALAPAPTAAEREARAPNVPHPPTLWAKAATWPDPVVWVADVAVAKAAIVADLQTAMEGGVIAHDVEEVAGMRAAATALEARIDAILVEKAVPPSANSAIQRAVAAALAAEVARAGGRELWLAAIARRGEDAVMRERSLATQARLDWLAAPLVLAPTETELRERYSHQRQGLTLAAAVQVREVAVALAPTAGEAERAIAEAQLLAQVHRGKLAAPVRGWQTRRELGEDRWAALAPLAVGELTSTVRTAFGLHRLQLAAKRPEHAPTFEEARPRLVAYVQKFRSYEAGHALLLRLRAGGQVKRLPPFDAPPGGLPVAGDVTVGAFEEDDD